MKRSRTPKGAAAAEDAPRPAKDGAPLSGSDDSDDDSDREMGGISMNAGEHNEIEDEDQGGDDEYEDKDDGKGLEITFAFLDPSDDHWGGIKGLLRKYPLVSSGAELSSLADEIAGFGQVGTVVCQDDGGEHVFAFISSLSVREERKVPWADCAKDFLVSKCPPKHKAAFEAMIRGDGAALLVREQLINLPPQLVPNLHASLINDLSWFAENAEAEEEEKDSNMKQFFFVAPFSEVESSQADSRGKKAKKGAGGGSSSSSATTTMFDRFDDEFLTQRSHLTFKFETSDGGKFMAGVIKLAAYAQCVEDMKKLF